MTKADNFLSGEHEAHSTTKSETGVDKRLIKPEEFGTLDKIVLLSPFGYAKIDKTPYYSTKEFRLPLLVETGG
jgi:hypothetical protein